MVNGCKFKMIEKPVYWDEKKTNLKFILSYFWGCSHKKRIKKIAEKIVKESCEFIRSN